MGAPKGTKPPGGSRLNKPNKFTAAVKDMVEAALSEAGGKEYLLRQSKENPVAFLGLVKQLMPKDVHVTGGVDVVLSQALRDLPEK